MFTRKSLEQTTKQRMIPLLLILLLGLSGTSASALPCAQTFPSQPSPTSVHSIRPSDISVFSAIGHIHMHSELSNVVSRFQELITLFNPEVVSTLRDQSNLYSELSHPRSLVEEAKELTLHLMSNQVSKKDWKLVMLFVQLDELCACQEPQISTAVKKVVQEVNLAVQVLQEQLKQTIVNVAIWNGEYETRRPYQNRVCECMDTQGEGQLRLLRATTTQVLQEALGRHLLKNQWYNHRDDFTVQLQGMPFLPDPVSIVSGRAPSEIQESRHTDQLTVQLWANLLQPASGPQNMEDTDMMFFVPCPSEDRPYLRTENNSPSDHHSEPSPFLDPIMGTEMPCDDLSPSDSPPESVHALRPGDIKVVAAVGDSLTAGNGVGASPNNLLDVLRQYRGLSWSIGGDENLTTVTTLPNILKHFNPLLTGYSTGMGKEETPQAFLNQAVAGQRSKDMSKQVRNLVARMKNDSSINFESDWKVITMFIGGNDICDYCSNSLFYSVDNYVRHIREALDYLHEMVPRALVNLVEPLQIVPLRDMHLDPSVQCPTWLVKILCPCVILPKDSSMALQQLDDLNRSYQQALNALVESGRYDTHPFFTVITQPFLREIVLPRLEDGRPDRSFFSPDCFHLSQKAQTLMARGLWNNMLEPLGYKTAVHNFTSRISLKCPSKTSPFVRTYHNSNYTYDGPPPTPPPIMNWGSDFTCVNLTQSSSVPTSVHMLRPGDIKVVAALGDSSTAGVGAKSKNLLELKREYKGVSWSIGGDQTLETVTTLPNILKMFNPSLVGFSKGQGSLQKGFNMAMASARSSDIHAQAKALIKVLKGNKNVDFENDWKLVTIFVGANDLCNYCTEQNNLTPQNYSQNLMMSLDMLYEEIPRIMVNMVEIMQILPLRTVKKNDLGCTLMQRSNCPCLLNADNNSPELEEIKRINSEYQIETQYLAFGDRYNGREDFAIVLQPYLHNSYIPYIGEGQADLSFFSLDCFHISERAHAEMAIALWNNMLEPVGRKQSYNNFTYDRTKIHCPSEANPYIFTRGNSLPSPPEIPTTPSIIPGTTSSPSPVPTVVEHMCPTSVPVWVPVLLGIVGLLIGWGVTWKFFSHRQRHVKKEKVIEMKGTCF